MAYFPRFSLSPLFTSYTLHILLPSIANPLQRSDSYLLDDAARSYSSPHYLDCVLPSFLRSNSTGALSRITHILHSYSGRESESSPSMSIPEDFDDRQTHIEAEQEPYRPYQYQEENNGSWAGALPVKQGLYDPSLEKDACGVGFAWYVVPTCTRRKQCRC